MADNNIRRPRSSNQSGFDPTNVALTVYNFFIILLEYVFLHLKFFYYIFEHIYFIIFPKEVSVKDEIVLITGTAHGIGKQIALKYANLGAIVVCCDVNEKGNLETVAEIKSNGGKGHHYVCNVLNRDNIIEVTNKIKKDVGSVSILVNNAGIMPCHELLKTTEIEIRNMFEINVLAHFWLIQAILPDMIKNNHGHIVALSSCAGLFGLRNLVPYCSTKFAVRGLMQALYEELKADSQALNIKLTTIYPYMVDTGLCKKPIMRFPHLMRMVKPDEAADAIIQAQRRGIEETAIPKFYFYLSKVMQLFPKTATRVINDFLGAYVDSDLN